MYLERLFLENYGSIGKLDKPILVQNSLNENFKWFLDLLLDYSSNFGDIMSLLNDKQVLKVINTLKDMTNLTQENINKIPPIKLQILSNMVPQNNFTKSLGNIETILNEILETDNIKLNSGYSFKHRLLLTKSSHR